MIGRDCDFANTDRFMQIILPNDDHLHLEARSDDGSVARRYDIIVDIDLFGWTIVERRWGRIGTRGRDKTEAFERRDAADRHIRGLLRRRDSAHTRIGVAYRLVD